MPNPRITPKRRRRSRRPDVDPYSWALLTDSVPGDWFCRRTNPLPDGWNPFAVFDFYDKARELWAEHRERILRDWIDTRPGTRPSCWWLFDAPRDPKLGKVWDGLGDMHGNIIEGRRLLKGEGRPFWECSCMVPTWVLGIPHYWTGGDPEALVFESQHDYLARHGLLMPDEGTSTEPEFTPVLLDF